jgi:hypothetical protein
LGLDGLKTAATLCATALLLGHAGCDEGSRPERLLHGQPAAEFGPVDGSVVTQTRMLRGGFLGPRLTQCLAPADREIVSPDTVVVERVGVFGESLTFLDRAGRHVYACDGGVDPAGERREPWCGLSVGRLFDGKLLDPRLDILCHDPTGEPLAYAWVVPVAGAHWIGVDQGPYTELYEAAGDLPVRIASTRGVDRAHSQASFDVTQYGMAGRELVRGTLETAVSG